MSYIFKPRSELLDNLDLIAVNLFPPPLPRKIKEFLKENRNLDAVREEYLDATEGLIIRIARCDTFGEMGALVSKSILPVQACLWERFIFLKQHARQHPDETQMVPTSIGRYLRESLSALWHDSLPKK